MYIKVLGNLGTFSATRSVEHSGVMNCALYNNDLYFVTLVVQLGQPPVDWMRPFQMRFHLQNDVAEVDTSRTNFGVYYFADMCR